MSFKVICINDKFVDSEGTDKYPNPVFGNKYTVVHVHWISRHNLNAYELAEIPGNVCFVASYFAPISSISETDFIREYNKEKV